MKSIKTYFILGFFIILQSCVPQNQIMRVDFVIGTWQVDGKQTFESWEKVGDTLVGESFRIIRGEKQVSETLEIKFIDNNLVYIATVLNQNGGRGIPFILNKTEKESFSFENPDHDFPSKIQYKVVSTNELQVKVLGKDGDGFSLKMIKKS